MRSCMNGWSRQVRSKGWTWNCVTGCVEGVPDLDVASLFEGLGD